MQEQQKAESDAQALKKQLEKTLPEHSPKTFSPKNVDLVYQESEEDASMPLFSPQQSPHQFRTSSRVRIEGTKRCAGNSEATRKEIFSL